MTVDILAYYYNVDCFYLLINYNKFGAVQFESHVSN